MKRYYLSALTPVLALFFTFFGVTVVVSFLVFMFFFNLQTNNVLCACGVMAMNCGNFKNILFMFIIFWTEKPYSLCHYSLKCINIKFLSLTLQFLGIYLRYCWFLLIHASNILNTHQLELNYSLFFFREYLLKLYIFVLLMYFYSNYHKYVKIKL